MCVLRVYVETIFMACQKPILMLLMKANFIALLFDFTAPPPRESTGGVKMHSTQNVDKIVKSFASAGKTGKTGDKAKTRATAKMENLLITKAT